MIKHPKYPRANVYLSGGMQHAKNLGAGWRISCSNKLKLMEYFPLDITALDIAYQKNHGALYDMVSAEDVLRRKSDIRKHFVYTDLQLILNDSDALIVLYDQSVRRGAGTISECQVAYNNDIPVFLVSAYNDWSKEVPGWLQALSTKIFLSFDELYKYFDKLPYGILKRDVYGNHNADKYYLCSLCGDPFEKHKHHFVSKVSPLYCKNCVEIVQGTYESHKDRYQFFIEYLEQQSHEELFERKNKQLK